MGTCILPPFFMGEVLERSGGDGGNSYISVQGVR